MIILLDDITVQALEVLSNARGGLSGRAINDLLPKNGPPTVSQLISYTEAHGFVKKEVLEGTARHYSITPSGRKALKEYLAKPELRKKAKPIKKPKKKPKVEPVVVPFVAPVEEFLDKIGQSSMEDLTPALSRNMELNKTIAYVLAECSTTIDNDCGSLAKPELDVRNARLLSQLAAIKELAVEVAI